MYVSMDKERAGREALYAMLYRFKAGHILFKAKATCQGTQIQFKKDAFQVFTNILCRYLVHAFIR